MTNTLLLLLVVVAEVLEVVVVVVVSGIKDKLIYKIMLMKK